MRPTLILLILSLLFSGLLAQSPSFPTGVRQNSVCYQTDMPMKMDGSLKEAAWQAAKWSEYFLDIEGTHKEAPPLKTRLKMLWDANYLYVAVEMEEPHLWATITQNETVIFQDNDFELFIDPEGDSHHYFEWEVNALGTEWDLMLVKPYRDGGPAFTAWDIDGLMKGIALKGTLNDPSDQDEGWIVEVAIPFKALLESRKYTSIPKDGEQWRVNFSRVQWDLEVVDGAYQKVTRPGSNQPMPEHNWVWSPPGPIAMHQPELWGYVQFSTKRPGTTEVTFAEDPDEAVRWALWEVYYKQFNQRERKGGYAPDLAALGMERVKVGGKSFQPEMEVCGNLYELTLKSEDGKRTWHLRSDSKIWMREGKKKK